MRFSADENDPGYLPWRELGDRGKKVDVYLDGNLLDDVITADDVEGIVVVHARDEDGNFLKRGNQTVSRVLTGKVHISSPAYMTDIFALKRFLLFAGDDYYPAGGWDDFVDSFDLVSEAKAHLVNGDWKHIVDSHTGQKIEDEA